jgi:hypothetical protein
MAGKASKIGEKGTPQYKTHFFAFWVRLSCKKLFPHIDRVLPYPE